MAKSRIAFIAICMEPGPTTRDPLALVVGTTEPDGQPPAGGQAAVPADGKDWRYAFLRMSELKGLSGIDLHARAQQNADLVQELLATTSKQKNGTLTEVERSGLDTNIFSPTFLNAKLGHLPPGLPPGTTVIRTALVARNIERVFFFSRDGGQDLKGPIAALDTARVVEAEVPAGAAPMPLPFSADAPARPALIGSLLALFPDLSDPARPGAISALSLQLQIKVAANAHWLEEGEAAFDRHDTRLLFDLSAKAADKTGGPRRDMWHHSGNDWRGMQFDRMDLRCTLEPYKATGGTRSKILREEKTDILEFAVKRAILKYADSSRPGAAPFLPLLAAHGTPPTKNMGADITRIFGLRALAAFEDRDNKIVITRIGWRFELELYSDDLVSAVLRQRSLRRIYHLSDEIAGFMRNKGLRLAQEQRVEEIDLHLDAQRTVRTLVTARFIAEKGADAPDGKITEAVLGHLGQVVEQVHAGLKSVRDGEPLSLLPKLYSITQSVPWQLVGTLLDRSPGMRTLGGGKDALELSFSTLAPCAQYDLWDTSNRSMLKGAVRATLPRLVTEARRVMCYEFALGAPVAADGADDKAAQCSAWPAYQNPMTASALDGMGEELPFGTRISLTPTEMRGTLPPGSLKEGDLKPDPQPVLVQALQFAFATRPSGNVGIVPDCHILFWPSERVLENELPISIEAHMRLPIERVEAAAEDDLPAVARRQQRGHQSWARRGLPDADTPLLLPLPDRAADADTVVGGGTKAAPVANLSLAATEQVGPDRSHTIVLSVRASTEKKGDTPVASAEERSATRRRVLIIEPSPFRIAAVEYDPIVALGTYQNNEVAVWNQSGESGESWRVRDDKQIVDLIYPPQVLGEAMEKNRADLPGAAHDIQPDMPAAARFGTMTMLKLDPTYNDTAFREPGWNLRRILGYATQRSPGSRVLDLRLELLYGLLTRVRSEGLWITEIAGAIGAPPPLLPDKPSLAYLRRHLARMDAVLAAEQRRLAVDKLWRDRPDEDLRLADGLSHRLRLREPGKEGGPATPLRWPLAGAIPGDSAGLIDPEVLRASFSTSQDDRDSFPGGLAWAFDSANILMRVYGRPDSGGGSLRGACLTALGGFGTQRALFDDRKSIVESETTLGRVQRYRLERIGRIACLWHRAKHVIVYERTVVPSKQFFNRPPIGMRQDEHLGRALLRKVEEYVEIVAPVRRYPEDGSSIHEASFIVGAEFKSIKIRVDSAWGSDVRREGWKVPLWNTAFLGIKGDAANPDDPAFIYPKPQVCLLLADAEGKPLPHEVADPEKLYFYTSVIDGEGEDTDAWQTVRDVDFGDMPLPQVAPSRTDSADLHDAMQPPASPVVPGYERFTLTLVPSKELVALTHGRIPGGPLTSLRNVTVARAAAMPSTASEPVQQFGRELAAKVAGVRAELDRRMGRVLAELDKLEGADLKQRASDIIGEASKRLGVDELKKIIDDTGKLELDLPALNPACDSLKAKVRAQVGGQLNRLVIVAGDEVKSVSLALDKALVEVGSVAASQIRNIDAMLVLAVDSVEKLENADDDTRKRVIAAADAATQEIQRTVDRLRQAAAGEVKAQVDALKKRIGALPVTLRREAKAWRADTRANLGAVVQLASGGLFNVDVNLETWFTDTANAVKEFQVYLAGAGAVLTAEVKEKAVPLAAKLVEFRTKLQAEMVRIDSGRLPAEARRLLLAVDNAAAAMLRATRALELGVELTPLAPLSEGIKTALEALEALAVTVVERFTSSTKAIDALGHKLGSMLDEAFAAVDGPDGLVARLEDKVQEWEGALDDAQAQVLDALTTLDVLDAPIGKLLAELHKAAHDKPIPQTLKDAAAAVKTGLGNSREELRKGLGALDTLVAKAHAALREQTALILSRLDTHARALAQAIEAPLATVLEILSRSCAELDGLANKLIEAGKGAGEKLNEWLRNSLDLDGYQKKFQETVSDAIADGAATINEIKAAAARAAAEVTEKAEASARQLGGSLQESLRDIAGGADLEELARRADGIYQKGDKTLRALTALGDPPRTSNGIDYNRTDVRFVLAATKKLGIDMTPTLALVNRAADQVAAVENAGHAVGELLGSFGVRMPCSNIAESLVPDSLKGLSLSNFFPDIAGIDMKGLLKDVGFPDLDDMKAVKLRHRVDEASMRVYMDAEIDVPFTKAVPLMRFGPVEIVIDTARFTAAAHMEAGIDGSKNAMNGKIFGDWRIVSGGQTILTFRQTGLYFDDSGKIDFRIQPERIELAEALKFITDLMAATGQKGGLRIEPFIRGGIPSGVAATLDMVLPPIQTGAFGISDLSLHVMFGLAALPTFEIVSEMSIGMRTAPFTLNVWILNGGGYMLQRLSYLPSAKPQALMTYTLEIGIVVGLGIGFSFGVVSGGVWVQVGCSVASTWASQGSMTLMRVFLLVRGNVDVCGLITASITLMFEVSYDGARIVGAGTLTVRAKISMFYTLEVDQFVEYVFAGEKQKKEEDYAAAYC